jgi:hypothetical protein
MEANGGSVCQAALTGTAVSCPSGLVGSFQATRSAGAAGSSTATAGSGNALLAATASAVNGASGGAAGLLEGLRQIDTALQGTDCCVSVGEWTTSRWGCGVGSVRDHNKQLQ